MSLYACRDLGATGCLWRSQVVCSVLHVQHVCSLAVKPFPSSGLPRVQNRGWWEEVGDRRPFFGGQKRESLSPSHLHKKRTCSMFWCQPKSVPRRCCDDTCLQYFRNWFLTMSRNHMSGSMFGYLCFDHFATPRPDHTATTRRKHILTTFGTQNCSKPTPDV